MQKLGEKVCNTSPLYHGSPKKGRGQREGSGGGVRGEKESGGGIRRGEGIGGGVVEEGRGQEGRGNTQKQKSWSHFSCE